MKLKTALRCAATPIIDLMPASWREHFFFQNFNYDQHYYEHREIRPEMMPVYRTVAGLAAAQNRRLIDLGCGVGSFYGVLKSEYPELCNQYLCGIDSCKTAVHVARVNYGQFFLADDIVHLRWSETNRSSCFIALEVLEHLKDDIGLLQRLPKGSFVIASVPTFYSWDHVRRFKNVEAIFSRYSSVFATLHVKKVDKWFVFYGTTK